MEPIKKSNVTGIPAFLRKVMQDKKDIKEAFINKTSFSDLSKEKGIKFAKPL